MTIGIGFGIVIAVLAFALFLVIADHFSRPNIEPPLSETLEPLKVTPEVAKTRESTDDNRPATNRVIDGVNG